MDKTPDEKYLEYVPEIMSIIFSLLLIWASLTFPYHWLHAITIIYLGFVAFCFLLRERFIQKRRTYNKRFSKYLKPFMAITFSLYILLRILYVFIQLPSVVWFILTIGIFIAPLVYYHRKMKSEIKEL